MTFFLENIPMLEEGTFWPFVLIFTTDEALKGVRQLASISLRPVSG